MDNLVVLVEEELNAQIDMALRLCSLQLECWRDYLYRSTHPGSPWFRVVNTREDEPFTTTHGGRPSLLTRFTIDPPVRGR